MKKLFFLFIFILLTQNAIAENKKNEVKNEISFSKKDKFYTIPWGSGIEKILSSSKNDPKFKDKDKIVFNSDILNIDSEVTFFLNKEKLEKTKYVITKKYNSNDELIQDILFLKKNFNKMFGKLKFDSNPELDIMSADSYDNFINVILNQNNKIEIIWKKDKTKIILNVKKESFLVLDSIIIEVLLVQIS